MPYRIVLGVLVFVSTAFAGITVSSPGSGATVSSPVHFVAKATPTTSSASITTMRIYIDSVSVYVTSSASLDTNVTISTGTHNAVVQAWDSNGTVYKSARTITVQTTTPPVIPSNAKVFNLIEDLTGWQSCDVCAGANGQGPPTPHWMAQFQSTPSLDGSSAEFFVGGSTPYAAALWWKQLGPIDTATHFVYDMNFYFTDATAPQALEFDLNQSVNGKKYIFGTECDFHGAKTWRVWDTTLHWQDTGVSCTAAHTAKVWHSLRWEFQRTSGNQMHFIAVTVDGVRRSIDRYYRPQSSSVRELNVAFQMDGNSIMTDYHVWVDKIKLSAW